MKTWSKPLQVLLLALVAAVGAWGASARAEEAPTLATYGVDLVSDYVFRGNDVYWSVWSLSKAKHDAVNVSPAAQPSVTFFGPNGLSLNLWGSFAVANREDDTKKAFLGLGQNDELDYTLAYDWSNRLGAFTAGFIYYSYFGTAPAWSVNAAPVTTEAMFKWGMPFLKAVNPTLAHYATAYPGMAYTALSFGGGETVVWGLNIGNGLMTPNGLMAGNTTAPVKHISGIQDVTAKLGVVLGDFTVAANAAIRPTPELVMGGYDSKGKYLDPTDPKGVALADYPSTIMWLTLSYGGSAK